MNKKISTKYSIRKEKDYILLINTYDSKDIYLFDGVSKIIIDNLNKPISDIVKSIKLKYNVSSVRAESDINSFIKELIKNKILEDK